MKKILSIALIASLGFAFNLQTNNTKLIRKAPVANNLIYSYAPIVKKVIPSVVNISTTKTITIKTPSIKSKYFILPHKEIEHALGSGVIISKNGYIVTNNHVISNATKIFVFTHNGKRYKAKLIGADPKTDLAVIKIEAKNLTPIVFTNSNKIEVGDIALAIGNPFGLGETVTQGIISGLNRDKIGLNDYENFIQTDAAINPGNSGGALVDLKGRLIGINSAILTKSGGNNGIGFAIPSNMVKFVATSLITKGRLTRGYLGVEISDVNKNEASLYGIDYGVFINKVMPKTAAAKAKLKAGDIIVALNGKKVKDSATLRNEIAFLGGNSNIKLKIYRNHKFIIIEAKLKSLPIFTNNIDLLSGATIMQNGGKLTISNVLPKSFAWFLGVQKGDQIVAIKTINKTQWVSVNSIHKLKKLLKGLKPGEALMKLKRMNSVMIIQL